MSTNAAISWQEANQRALAGALDDLYALLQRHVSGTPAAGGEPPPGRSAGAPQFALETLCETFCLTPFERDVLLLCAGAELDSRFAALYAEAAGDPQRPWPTFSLALAALPGAHWGALTPAASLRRWRLIEVVAGPGLTTSPLRIDERVLHFLTGVDYLDERLAGLVQPLAEGDVLVPTHQALAEQIVAIWRQGTERAGLPIIQLCGGESLGKRLIAAAACARAGLRLHVMSAEALPTPPAELETVARLWEREAALMGSALLLDCDGMENEPSERADAVARLMERLSGVFLVASPERRRARRRPMVTFDVRKPAQAEQRALWEAALGPEAADVAGPLDELTTHFDVTEQAIRAVGLTARGRAALPESGGLERALWDACRVQARPRLDDLAQRIEPSSAWEDLILPDAQRQVLHAVAAHVRRRAMVYRDWGFAGRGSRGLGISALFSGESGTGKTTAAEVLAGELHLDLYRIDLSAVVSKYIGESEKNLRRVFDAAEEGGAILLFDEADALFGKRSDVKDSHDRYANIEVSYLLQRMEAYQGLAILTSNLKTALDTAFQRRIRFIVQFPFPGVPERTEIWRRVFPPGTPSEGLDPAKLARLNVAGGTIRNIALNAAFLAAEAGEPVRMLHLLRAAHTEYAKLEKTLTAAETAGWV